MDKTAGQVNYEAYRSASGGVSLIAGDPLPEWGELAANIQHAWEAGAAMVEQRHAAELADHLSGLGRALAPTARVAVVGVKQILRGWAG